MAEKIAKLEHNLKQIGHTTLGGAANVGEGLALKVLPDGRRLLYVAAENPPTAFSVLDVSDPRDPELLWQSTLPHNQIRSNSLAMWDDILLLANQTMGPGIEPAGFEVYSLKDPVNPKKIGFFDTSGPHSWGVHMVTMMDGRYAHISTGAPDFEPNHRLDYQFYMIVDMQDPANPKEVGRWWLPGQRKGEEPLVRHTRPSLDFAFRVHHALCYPEQPDRTYLGYIDGGAVILDISDKGNPKMISRLDYHPPMPGFTHTVMPFPGRGLMIAADEAVSKASLPADLPDGGDFPKLYWMVDIREETNPVIISTLPKPHDFDNLIRIGGRIGAHNIHENEHQPGAARMLNTVATVWFTAGVRLYDISDPFEPKEFAAFIPETPQGQTASRMNDVFVDDRGILYAGDRMNGGLYTLEYTGDRNLD